jgi:hypothetical protein
LRSNRRRGDLATWRRINIADREQGDSFSIGQREKTQIASLPAWCFNSNWLNFFPKQVRCGIVQCDCAKIERMVICHAHCVKAGPSEQLRGLCRSPERISIRGYAEIRNRTFQVGGGERRLTNQRRNTFKWICAVLDLCCATATEHDVATENQTGRRFCWRDAIQIEAILSALFQELTQRQQFWSARELVRHEIVLIENAHGISILDHCGDVCPEMNDCAALQILRCNSRCARCG